MSGSVENQAVYSMNVAQSWDVFQTKGAGVKIGVLSDSFNNLGHVGDPLDYARDISTGDLPDNVVVLKDMLGSEESTDEGRAMLQLIYDIAPEAELYFHAAGESEADFAAGVRALAGAGCTVIVDDIYFGQEPVYMDGVISQAIDEVTATGVVYLSSAGNNGRGLAYEAPFADSGQQGGQGGVLHDFDPGPGVDVTQGITVHSDEETFLIFQWDQPFATATNGQAACSNDLDFFLYDTSGNLVASSTQSNIGGSPLEGLILPPGDGENGVAYDVVISLNQGEAPGLMKLLPQDEVVTINEYATDSPNIAGHAGAEGTIGVGAVSWEMTPAYGVLDVELEDFSSDGPVTILFDDAGNRLTTPEIRDTPLFSAPDGTYTSFFDQEVEEGVYSFYGTSAAAPNAAAVVALMLSLEPDASRDQIVEALAATALDMESEGYDYDSGYGLIQADDALAYLTQGQDFAPVYEVSLGSASLWTDSRDEKLSIISDQVWSYDGIAFGEALGPDVVPTYRFYNAITNDHLLTTSTNERDSVLATHSDWYVYEGESFSVFASEQEGSTELHRFYDSQNHLHYYTADAGEYEAWLEQPGFSYEGVMGWVEPLMV